MPEDREGLRRTFDSVADRYERARPTYPEALYNELAHLADLRPGDRLLEVGCGTGQATVPLARRGFQITCVELGHELAAVARRQLEPFPEVERAESVLGYVLSDCCRYWEFRVTAIDDLPGPRPVAKAFGSASGTT